MPDKNQKAIKKYLPAIKAETISRLTGEVDERLGPKRIPKLALYQNAFRAGNKRLKQSGTGARSID